MGNRTKERRLASLGGFIILMGILYSLNATANYFLDHHNVGFLTNALLCSIIFELG
jgi:hypothetical protein